MRLPCLQDDPAPPKEEPAATLDLSRGRPENFPVDALPRQIADVASDLAAVYNMPVCLPAMSAIGIISGAIGKSVAVKGGYMDKRTMLNVYVCAGAQRGSGKGNTGILAKPISDRSQKLSRAHRNNVSGKKADAGVLRERIKREQVKLAGNSAAATQPLAEMQSRLIEIERESRRQTTLMIDNATSEAALSRLQDNEETLFYFSAEAAGELQVALGKYNRNGGADFNWLLSAYSGDFARIDRQGRDPVEMESPCLALLWMVQPSVLQELIAHREAMQRGLTARFMMFDTGARREMDDGKSQAFTKSDAWNALINGILDRRESGRFQEIECTPEAREVFRAFNNDSVAYEREPLTGLDGELSRWRENAIKVAGIFAAADDETTITPETANNACAIVLWAGTNYLTMLCKAQDDRMRRQLDHLLDIVAEAGGEIAIGILASKHSIKREVVDGIIASLPGHLRIERKMQAGSKGGRPRETLVSVNQVNPVNQVALLR